MPFLADADLSYNDEHGNPVIECHAVSIYAAAHEVWSIARLISGYIEFLGEL